MKMSLPRTKMLDEAKQSKGHFIIVEILIFAAVFFLPLILFGVIFVSIVWTHRPDLSVADIGREVLKEIKDTRAGKNRQARITWQKGKTK